MSGLLCAFWAFLNLSFYLRFGFVFDLGSPPYSDCFCFFIGVNYVEENLALQLLRNDICFFEKETLSLPIDA